MKKEIDKHASYKLVFMKIAHDFIQEPTPKKEAKLKSLVLDTLVKDPELLNWFNTMFRWENTDHGVSIDYKIKEPTIPCGN